MQTTYIIDKVLLFTPDQAMPYGELAAHTPSSYGSAKERRAIIELHFPDSDTRWLVVLARGNTTDSVAEFVYDMRADLKSALPDTEFFDPKQLPLRDLDGLYFKRPGDPCFRQAAFRELVEQERPFWWTLNLWIERLRERMAVVRGQLIPFEKQFHLSMASTSVCSVHFYEAVERWNGTEYEVEGDSCYLPAGVLDEFDILVHAMFELEFAVCSISAI